jgi:hypothetical protein
MGTFTKQERKKFGIAVACLILGVCLYLGMSVSANAMGWVPLSYGVNDTSSTVAANVKSRYTNTAESVVTLPNIGQSDYLVSVAGNTTNAVTERKFIMILNATVQDLVYYGITGCALTFQAFDADFAIRQTQLMFGVSSVYHAVQYNQDGVTSATTGASTHWRNVTALVNWGFNFTALDLLDWSTSYGSTLNVMIAFRNMSLVTEDWTISLVWYGSSAGMVITSLAVGRIGLSVFAVMAGVWMMGDEHVRRSYRKARRGYAGLRGRFRAWHGRRRLRGRSSRRRRY